MIIPSVTGSEAIEAQVAVIGAGPAGMSLALALSRLGRDVALLSSGSFGPDRLSRSHAAAEALPAHHVAPEALEARRLGGLSWSWGGRCLPPDPQDFEPRPDLDLPGWPIERDELMRHAGAAADFLGIGPPDFQSGDRLPGVRLLLERWAAQPQLAVRHRGALSARSGPRVYTDVTCTGGRIDENGRICALEAQHVSGDSVEIRAGAYVIAAGGLETARLLLWIFEQNGRTAPKWTGRGYMGHIKAHIARIRADDATIARLDYRATPECFLRNRVGLSEEVTRLEALPNINFWLDNPMVSDPSHGVPGLSLAYLALSAPVVGKRLLPPAMRGYFLGDGEPGVAAHLRNVLRNPYAAAAYCYGVWNGRRSEPVRPGRVVRPGNGRHWLTCSAEERPRFDNGVTLGQGRDPYGVPRAVIARELHPDDLDGVIRAGRVLEQSLAGTGAAEVSLDGSVDDLRERIAVSSADGYHQIGTARMGPTAEDSVTDANCRVHGTENLWVAGSSVFPRSGQANPTFAIVCISSRMAHHLHAILDRTPKRF